MSYQHEGLYCVDVEATLARGWSDLWRRINYSRLHSSLKANTNTWLHFPLLRWCACLSWFIRFNADLFICRRVRACARVVVHLICVCMRVCARASVWLTCDPSFVARRMFSHFLYRTAGCIQQLPTHRPPRYNNCYIAWNTRGCPWPWPILIWLCSQLSPFHRTRCDSPEFGTTSQSMWRPKCRD